jgi:putative ABC transport system ATP-binding protein
MIKLKNITKIYELNKSSSVTAIKDVDLDIKQGELVVLKGVSGSGKSTILSLIAGLSRPTYGEVIVDGKRVSKLPDSFASKYRQESIGFIFQKYNLIANLSVKDNVLIPLVPINPNEDEAIDRVLGVLKSFNLEDKIDTIVKNLSGGEQQRVAISRALINRPKVIVADEPTANLDEVLSLGFIEILESLKMEGKTIVVATHDPLFFDLDIVDRVIEIKNGEIL